MSSGRTRKAQAAKAEAAKAEAAKAEAAKAEAAKAEAAGQGRAGAWPAEAGERGRELPRSAPEEQPTGWRVAYCAGCRRARMMPASRAVRTENELNFDGTLAPPRCLRCEPYEPEPPGRGGFGANYAVAPRDSAGRDSAGREIRSYPLPALRRARLARALNKSELSGASGVSASTIGRLEADPEGKHAQTRTAHALADALGVPVAVLRSSPGPL